jgi:hypothetical protein
MSIIKCHIKSCIGHYHSENLLSIHFYTQVTVKVIYLEDEQASTSNLQVKTSLVKNKMKPITVKEA